ncbi:hypothetical protein [Achromobacter sp.]|uniref:hypothetical protein n=1 Tax=Achromobacter sp. TaxID=134375 RepID=UPI002F951238
MFKVVIKGMGRSDLNHHATSLGPRLIDFYRPAQQRAAAAGLHGQRRGGAVLN